VSFANMYPMPDMTVVAPVTYLTEKFIKIIRKIKTKYYSTKAG